jgi:hypothetical protein
MSYLGDRSTPGSGPHLPPLGILQTLQATPSPGAQSYSRCKIIIEMDSSTNSPERFAVPRWHVWVCLCLALFLLYNPYMAAPSSTNGLNVCHPGSNRATVGASELQHFSPADGRDKFSTHATVAVEPLALSPGVSSPAFEHFPQVASPTQQFFGSSLWFRPPPVL